MFITREARDEAKGLSDLIDYYGLAADGVVETSTGIYLAAWEFAGPDMDSLPVAECFAMADQLARHFALGPGWYLQSDLIRAEYTEYIGAKAAWPDPLTAIIDEERQTRFLLSGVDGATMLSRRFFCIAYESSERGMKAASRKLVGLAEERDEASDVVLARFQKKVREIENALKGMLKTVRRLKGYKRVVGQVGVHCDELLEYIRLCIEAEHYPFAVPDVPIDLNQYLATKDFTGGADLQLGDPDDEMFPGEHIRVLSIDSFPSHSFAGILREMDAVPLAFRLTHQAQILNEMEAAGTHEKNKKMWRAKGTGGLKGQLRTMAVTDLDNEALELSGDAARAQRAAEHGREFYCHYSGKVILRHRSTAVLRQSINTISRALKLRCGFGCRVESVNAVAAWVGSLPGQQYKDPRHFTINTANLAHMLPLSEPWRGHAFNPSPYFPKESPPLLMGATAGGAPYRFNSYVGDVGHVLVVGPNGSGKTSAYALAMAQAFRYDGAQVYGFDKKRSLYTLTRTIGGDFIDLSPEGDSKLCPLADLSSESEIAWAKQYIALLVDLNGQKVTPDVRNAIGRAIDKLARSRNGGRSLNDLHMACDSQELKQALEFYLGTILDGQEDGLALSRFSVFEMDRLYGLDKAVMNGVLFYLFARIRRRLRSDRPTFMFVDEFREALSHPIAARHFQDFLYEGRKLNLAVWLSVQELKETIESPLGGAVLGQIMTRICLPNAQALLEAKPQYVAIGCNNVDIALIAGATRKRDYYVMNPEGNRLISLELGRVMLALLASGDNDREHLDTLMQQLGHQRAVSVWLRERGAADWATRYEALAGIAGEPAAEEAAFVYA